MRLAVARMVAGEPTRIPYRLGVHLVAARYGTTPRKVRDEWTGPDYVDALSFLGVSGNVR